MTTRETFTFDNDALKDLEFVKEALRLDNKSYAVRTALREYRKLLEQKEAING